MLVDQKNSFFPQLALRAPLPILALLLSAAQIPPAPLADSEEIVVEGKALLPDEARDRAIAYVQQTGVVTGKEMVARWIDKVCPRATGLAPEHARIVETGFRAVAARVGAPLAAPGCRTNVMISFVGDGAAFTRMVARGDRRRLGDISFEARHTLLHGAAPIRWWYSDELRTRGGMRSVATDPPFVTTLGIGPVLPSNGAENVTMSHYNSSQISTQINRALTQATIVVDAQRSSGAPLNAVAAYAAFVALAEVTPPPRPVDGSILGLFGDAPPAGLSRLDEAFLRELYALPLDRKARQQRSRLVRALQKEPSRF